MTRSACRRDPVRALATVPAVVGWMPLEFWLMMGGAFLLAIALLEKWLRKLPVTPAIIYLVLGALLGPWGWDVLRLSPVSDVALLHRGAEAAVVISLFTVGLKIRLRWDDPRLRPALGLATISMVLTIAAVVALGTLWLNLPLGAAVLLGAVLAPTDPVLASEVQIQHPLDQDKLRLTLSGEAGLNDGTAFPFVMLGLGLLGAHELGEAGWRWLAVDVVWAAGVGIAIGALIGRGAGYFILHVNRRRREALVMGEFVVLGIVGLAYGLAVMMNAYGFLAVFAAGFGLRSAERGVSGDTEEASRAVSAMAEMRITHSPNVDGPEGPAFFVGALLATNEQLERLLEIALVMLTGAMLATAGWSWPAAAMAAVVFLLVRPVAVLPVLLSGSHSKFAIATIGWFGIRGIGSLYYLSYAIVHGLPEGIAGVLASSTLTVVALSVLVHGITGAPVLGRYRRWREGAGRRAAE